MINGLVGRPRAGKSYEAVMFHILPAAKEGRLVVTNIPVKLDAVQRYYGDDVANSIIVVEANYNEYGMIRPFSVPEDFTKHDWKNDKGQGPLFVVDEAHLSLGLDAKKPVLEYLSLHGHYGHDILVLTQSPRKLHRDLKDMIEVCWRCVKKSVFGDDTHYIKKTYHGVPTRNEGYVHEEEREYQQQFFQFYQSHTQSSTSVDEAKPSDIKAKLNPYKGISIAMIVVGAV
ncbi:zonular occludens toxin domain-containing protein, partial [Shewanella algae]